jgi:hypothetical protein
MLRTVRSKSFFIACYFISKVATKNRKKNLGVLLSVLHPFRVSQMQCHRECGDTGRK